MSALGQKRTYAVQNAMSALPPIATSIALFGMSALSQKRTFGFHSITSSARARSCDGIAMPSDFAVLRLMISSNLTGSSTGSSPSFAPFSIFPNRAGTANANNSEVSALAWLCFHFSCSHVGPPPAKKSRAAVQIHLLASPHRQCFLDCASASSSVLQSGNKRHSPISGSYQSEFQAAITISIRSLSFRLSSAASAAARAALAMARPSLMLSMYFRRSSFYASRR